MSWIWTLFLASAIICSVATGKTAALSAALLEGAQKGITLTISLAGPLCLWSGLSALLSHTGLTDRLSGMLAPFLRRLFPEAWKDRTTREAICGNLTANLLGLGNAATPLGICAAQRMAHTGDHYATDELCRLIVLNTASIQLVPTTVAAVRAGLGAAAPFDILPAVWITSFCSVCIGLLAARGFSKWAP